MGDYPPDLQVGDRFPLSPAWTPMVIPLGQTGTLCRAVTEKMMMIIQSAKNAWYPCRRCSDVTMKGRTQLRRESLYKRDGDARLSHSKTALAASSGGGVRPPGQREVSFFSHSTAVIITRIDQHTRPVGVEFCCLSRSIAVALFRR